MPDLIKTLFDHSLGELVAKHIREDATFHPIPATSSMLACSLAGFKALTAKQPLPAPLARAEHLMSQAYEIIEAYASAYTETQQG